MKLLADENLPRTVIKRLRQDGWDVLAMSDIAPGDGDDRVIGRAHSAGLILITQDRDFGELAIARALPVVGVVLVELERLSLPLQAERLSECLKRRGTTWSEASW